MLTPSRSVLNPAEHTKLPSMVQQDAHLASVRGGGYRRQLSDCLVAWQLCDGLVPRRQQRLALLASVEPCAAPQRREAALAMTMQGRC